MANNACCSFTLQQPWSYTEHHSATTQTSRQDIGIFSLIPLLTMLTGRVNLIQNVIVWLYMCTSFSGPAGLLYSACQIVKYFYTFSTVSFTLILYPLLSLFVYSLSQFTFFVSSSVANFLSVTRLRCRCYYTFSSCNLSSANGLSSFG